MDRWTGAAAVVIDVLGFLVAVGLTAVVVYLVRKPLREFLAHLLGDERVAAIGTTFVAIVIALRGLAVALDFIRQGNLNEFFTDLVGMLNVMADEVQWVVWIGALLFIGYSIRAWRQGGSPEA